METEEKLSAEVIWKMFAETDRRIKENDRRLTAQFKETGSLLSEKFKETDYLIRQLRGHFDKQFGKLVEALIQHSTINLFKEKGIQITHSSPNPERVYDDINMEFDLLLLNKTELVVIGAKVSLTKQKVYQFIKKLENFKLFFNEYSSYKVYAGLAYVTSKSDARELAEANGFYLLKLRNEEYMEFGNTPQFCPKICGTTAPVCTGLVENDNTGLYN